MRIRALSFAASILLATVKLTSCGGAGASNEAADVRLPGTEQASRSRSIRNGSKSIAKPIRTSRSTINRRQRQRREELHRQDGRLRSQRQGHDARGNRRAEGNVQLLPLTAGNIVLTYNMPGVKELKLSREAYVGIFLGKLKTWNDPAIAKTNAGAKLPDSAINVVVRADSERHQVSVYAAPERVQ